MCRITLDELRFIEKDCLRAVSIAIDMADGLTGEAFDAAEAKVLRLIDRHDWINAMRREAEGNGRGYIEA